ncbi:hypothetical protein C5B42_01405 [Candidatus Cerribacteria bacterium 'Amazon FNV 2010 28 9']|uniref:Ferric oxidoreductase domain-containing protein n=1 Tax=Candidatus Cerribacteria bacterium 'Amazon FNV 2010 28 9' TaxID=2081795 RepID=A0A317JTL7_9BACT|nr:MAG: hypothetical protein C5B42_01405 [Candidatus Cerribacteria bacterium 'Amazon FNV 2010 28 9']
MWKQIEDALFTFSAANRKTIIQLFYAGYGVLIVLFLVATFVFGFSLPYTNIFYFLGKGAGFAAAGFFVLAIAAGLIRRFGYSGKLFPLLITYRRHFGISCFLFAFFHAYVVRLLPSFVLAFQGFGFPPFFPFELFGVAALLLLFPLFVTSNDWSTKRMGKWWKRLHSLVYVIVWLIFFHVAVQGGGLMADVLGLVAALEIISLIYRQLTKNKPVAPPPVPPAPAPQQAK